MADYTYTTPTQTHVNPVNYRGMAGSLVLPVRSRPQIDVGLCVLNESGVYRTVVSPSIAEMEAATAYYLGGRDHTVDSATKTAIEASGVGGEFVAQ